MQRITEHWWWALALTGLVCGCGGQANLPPPKDPPKPVPVAAVAPAPAGGQSAAPANAKPAAKAKGKVSPASPFANENPANVFEVASIAEPMTPEVAPRFFDNEKYVVTVGSAGLDSTRFTAVGSGKSAVSPAAAASSFKLPEGFTALSEFGVGEESAPLRIRCNKDDSVMALVTAGTSLVGSDNGPTETQPSFMVFLDTFYMDITEVTAAQFEVYRDELRKEKKRVPPPSVNANAGEGWPALGVSWGDAQNYARWAGKELPTEAEFEKAARGPEGFHSPWGNGRAVWGTQRTAKTLVAVGAYVGDQSLYGIYDLAGNAREWTADFYRPNAHLEAAEQAASKALRNWPGPKTATSGSQRVIKGAGDDWAMWHRAAADMSATLPDVGFRGVLRISTGKTGTEAGTPKPATPRTGTPKTGTPKTGY